MSLNVNIWFDISTLSIQDSDDDEDLPKYPKYDPGSESDDADEANFIVDEDDQPVEEGADSATKQVFDFQEIFGHFVSVT